MNWKRNQKYLSRPRHLYGLFFDNGCCYVGQTVDLKQREQQHRSARGGWQGRRFSFVPLSSMTGTQADAELHEYAWRYKAFQKGWRIYSKPPGLAIRDPRRHTTAYMKSLAAGYTWPTAPTTPTGGWEHGERDWMDLVQVVVHLPGHPVAGVAGLGDWSLSQQAK